MRQYKMRHINYITNKHGIYSDVFDREVVIVNLNLGNYYNVRNVASAIWRSLELGTNIDRLIIELKNIYTSDVAIIEQNIHSFIDELIKDGLILESNLETTEANNLTDLPSEYTAPILEVFNDLQDLFLLDPVHAVDDKMGWPIQANN